MVNKYGKPEGIANNSPDSLPVWPEFDNQYQRYIELGMNHTLTMTYTLTMTHTMTHNKETVKNKGNLKTHILPQHRQCAFWNEFIPELMGATAPIKEAELRWKNDLTRWDAAMNRWESAFEKYDRNSRKRH